MRASTEVTMGFRNVGDGDAEPIIESMLIGEALKRVCVLTLEATMAKRIQIVVARNRDEVMVGLGLSKTNQEAKRTNKANEIAGFIDSLFDAPAGAGMLDESTNSNETGED